jgi:hypothetical protein
VEQELCTIPEIDGHSGFQHTDGPMVVILWKSCTAPHKTFPDKKKCFSSVLNLTQEQLVD